MKAIEIIKAMVYDSALAECVQVHTYHGPEYMTPKGWIEHVLGDMHVERGELETSDYIVVWSCDFYRVYPFCAENAPDVVLERNNPEQYDEEDRQVYLYKIS